MQRGQLRSFERRAESGSQAAQLSILARAATSAGFHRPSFPADIDVVVEMPAPHAVARYRAEGRAPAKDAAGQALCDASPMPAGAFEYDYLRKVAAHFEGALSRACDCNRRQAASVHSRFASPNGSPLQHGQLSSQCAAPSCPRTVVSRRPTFYMYISPCTQSHCRRLAEHRSLYRHRKCATRSRGPAQGRRQADQKQGSAPWRIPWQCACGACSHTRTRRVSRREQWNAIPSYQARSVQGARARR